MTKGLLQHYPVWYHTTSVLCDREVADIDHAESELIRMDSELVNGAEMSPEEKRRDIKKVIARYIEGLEGVVYVSEIARALGLDINLVISILEELGFEVD